VFFLKRSASSETDLDTLLKACLLGKASAQRTLFKQFYGYAKRSCLLLTANPKEAEEVLNDSFLSVFQHLHQYNRSGSFKVWLHTIVINTALGYYRKRHRLEPLLELDLSLNASFDETLMDRMRAEDLLTLIQRLPGSERMVFSLHVVEGYSLSDIAVMLDGNEALVRAHYLRASRSLRELIAATNPHVCQVY